MNSQSYKCTDININGQQYDALISMTRPSVSTPFEAMQNYKGDHLPDSGGGSVEYGDITAVFAEREFDRLREDLGAVDVDGFYKNDLSDYAIEIQFVIDPEDPYNEFSRKEVFCQNCRIIGSEPTSVEKGSTYYTMSTTIKVGELKERKMA